VGQCALQLVEEVVGKHIVNVINSKEVKATVMETILKNKAMGPELTWGVEKEKLEDEEMVLTARIVNR
jgi:hypothetical protein